MTKLLLFDIDGTLIKPGHSRHGTAFEYVVRNHTGNEVKVDDVDPCGRIDNEIMLKMLQLAGMEASAAGEALQDCYDKMIPYYREHEIDMRAYVLPGVINLLEELKNCQCVLALLTGNHELIAMHKLNRAGIDSCFTLGAFGNEAWERSELVDMAIERAGAIHRAGFAKKDVFLIGDTPRDILCGKKGGVVTVGVATGHYSEDELRREKADLVLADFTQNQALLSFVFAG